VKLKIILFRIKHFTFQSIIKIAYLQNRLIWIYFQLYRAYVYIYILVVPKYLVNIRISKEVINCEVISHKSIKNVIYKNTTYFHDILISKMDNIVYYNMA